MAMILVEITSTGLNLLVLPTLGVAVFGGFEKNLEEMNGRLVVPSQDRVTVE